MVEVYAVVGESESRKSAVIRCLTGVYGQTRNWAVAWATNPGGPTVPQKMVCSVPDGKKITTPTTTYVQIRAPQEARISVKDMANAVSSCGDEYLVIALRKRPAKGYPSAEDYLQHFASLNWTLHPYIELGAIHKSAPPIRACSQAAHYPNSKATPANLLANSVRSHWPII